MKNVKILTRVLCAFLMAAMLLGVVACSGEDGKKEETTASSDAETTEREWLDSLEDTDFNDATLTVLLYSPSNWIGLDENTDTKEVVNASVDRTARNVAERFNVKIEQFERPSGQTIAEAVRNMGQSQMYEFDYVSGDGRDCAPLALEGYFINMNDAEEFDIISLDKEWWNSTYTDALNVSDYMYWMNGYTWVGDIHQVYCVFFNIEMSKLVGGADFNIYDLAREGKWTLDEMTKYVKLAYKDDGNGTFDDADTYGFSMQSADFIDKVAMCAGADYTKRDEYNIPVVNVETERNIAINEKIYDLLNNDGCAMYSSNSMYAGEGEFAKGQMLFYCDNLDCANHYRDVEWDFGVLPMPKFDENQENYLNTYHYRCPVDGIPTTTPEANYEMCFTIAEAIAAETYRLVRPAWLDVALKNKYSRDEDTKEMIDLTQGNMTTDFLVVYGYSTGVEKMFNAAYDTRDVSSQLARKGKPMTKLIDKLVAQFESNAE